MQLWQFLLECLEDRNFRQMIRWTNSITPTESPTPTTTHLSRRNTNTNEDVSCEFCIQEPKELARIWTIRKYGHELLATMEPNYFQRFNRIIRYYLNKKRLLQKIVGKPNTYVFQINVRPYINALRARSFSLGCGVQQHDKMIFL